jgi:hypothetical protein
MGGVMTIIIPDKIMVIFYFALFCLSVLAMRVLAVVRSLSSPTSYDRKLMNIVLIAALLMMGFSVYGFVSI